MNKSISLKSLARKSATWLVAAAMTLALAGCAHLPESGSIQDGPEIQAGTSSDYLYYSPSSPEDGMTQSQVLTGFLNAATGPQNDFAIAREFLSPEISANWTPNKEVLIQQGSLSTSWGPGETATVNIAVSATVDADGHYRVEPSGTQRVLNYSFAKVKGQWRISSAPNAVVLIRPVFDVIYHAYSLYFFDHGFNYLVPDLRWFPSRTSTATRLVAAVIQGPSTWLSGAVETTMPVGTKLAIDAVTVEKDVAQVDLNSVALQSSQSRRQYFKAQLLATLRQIAGVNRVQILIDRSPQKISDYVPASAASKALAPVVLSDGQLRQVSSPSTSQLTSASKYATQLGASQFALSADLGSLALKTPAGIYQVQLGQVGAVPVLADSRQQMLDPKFDRRGFLWTTAKQANGLIQVKPPAGEPLWIRASWLKDARVGDFALSAEGSRIAFTVQRAGHATHIEIGAVIRNRAGVPIGIGPAYPLKDSGGIPRSLDWSGENQLVALMSAPDGQTSVTTFSIGGDFKVLGQIQGGVRVIAGDSGSNVYVIDKDGSLLQYRGYAWNPVAHRVDAAHMVN